MQMVTHTLNRRRLLGAAGLALTGLAPWARAQDTPLRILVGFAAGGSADLSARLLADQLRVQLGRPVLVENRTGAAGRLAVEATKSAKPDGNTLMFVPHGPMTLFPYVYKALRFDPFKDFTPIGRVSSFDYALSTGPATPAKTISEYLAWARVPGNKASFGSPGAGTVPHFIGQGFAQKAGLALTHVPYRGAAPSMVDLIGGSVSLVVSPLADAIEHHKAGKLRVLATTGEQRTEMLTGVPTLRETGMDLTVDGWYGLYGPAGLAPELVQTLSKALDAAALQLREPFAKSTLRAAATSPAQLQQLQRREAALWQQLVAASGFRPED